MSISDMVKIGTEGINEYVISNRRKVIVTFILLTAVFAWGSVLIPSETPDIGDELPEQKALDSVNEKFGNSFEPESSSTQVIQKGGNVLTKQELINNIQLIDYMHDRDKLQFGTAVGPAPIVAQAIDPSAKTVEEQQRVLQSASTTEIRQTIRGLADNQRFTNVVSNDFNPTAVSASTSITSITHGAPVEISDSDLTAIQTSMQAVVIDQPGDFRVFGSGLTNAELNQAIGDSLLIVIPAVGILLISFLAVAYRDPTDLILGLLSLLMTGIWLFGFLGYAGIPFSLEMITVLVLVLAVGVDFGIHIINRYREEEVRGYEGPEAMRRANNQMMVALILVTITAVFGFGANIISDLATIQNIGLASSAGVIFMFLIFGVFLPAAKLETDQLCEQLNIPRFSSTPIASEDSTLGRLLAYPAVVSQYAPVVFIVGLLLTGGIAGLYGAGISSSFETQDYLPPEEQPAYVSGLPGPFAPGEYTAKATINLLDEKFETNQDKSVKLYIEGNFEEGHALEALAAPSDNPPDSIAVGSNGDTQRQSIVTVIQSYARQDPQFDDLVTRNDLDNNGIPDQNLDHIYDELFTSEVAPLAKQYLTEDRRSAQVEYAIDSDVSTAEAAADTRELAGDFRYRTTATGQVVVDDAINNVIVSSAIQGLLLAVGLTVAFLVIAYWILEQKPMLGIVNIFPILIATAGLVGTMRYIGIALNPLTATTLTMSIGIGIAYSVHITHRFVDEFNTDITAHKAMVRTLSGTGGALFGSMLTTSLGTSALTLAITPILGEFGLIMAIGVVYTFVFSIIALPPAVLLWDRYRTFPN